MSMTPEQQRITPYERVRRRAIELGKMGMSAEWVALNIADANAHGRSESLADCRVVWAKGWPLENRDSVEKVGVQE